MAETNPEPTPTELLPEDHPSESTKSSLSRSNSLSRLNAQAPEFVPRTPPASHTTGRIDQRMVQIHPVPPPHSVIRIFQHPPPPAFHHIPHIQNQFEYYGGGGGGFREQDMGNSRSPSDPDHPPSSSSASAAADLSDDVIYKITNQVEYYFSDINLATTEHLMRFINKDSEGFVPMTVIAGFKKIKSLVNNNYQLACALRTSSKLVVSDDGKKVKRQQPFTEADLEELQSRIVVAENLPDDHSYQNLVRVFSTAGRVKTIRTCYPQTSSISGASATSKTGKLDVFLGNKLHAFVEYETSEEAEKALTELNEEKNWRSGLRLRLLPRCMNKYGLSRGRKGGSETEGFGEDEDVSTSNQLLQDRHFEDPLLSNEASHENLMDDGYQHEREAGGRRGRGRGRGGRGRSRGSPAQAPSHLPLEHSTAPKQPLGPRMPDGTRGFSMGRGKPTSLP